MKTIVTFQNLSVSGRDRPGEARLPGIAAAGGVLLLGLLVILACGKAGSASAQLPGWSTPVSISSPPGYSWFPDLAVDEMGDPHIIFCHTTPNEIRTVSSLSEQINYTKLSNGQWTTPNDIVPISRDIVRSAIASNLSGSIYILHTGSPYQHNFGLYFMKAAREAAWSAQNWSEPLRINRGISYTADIGVDSQRVIHAVYDDTIRHAPEETNIVSDIYYRRSADGGKTWSDEINLYSEPESGSARSLLKIDSSNGLHVTWDEGWDRLSDFTSKSFHSVYINSLDGGQTWSQPTIIAEPGDATVQLVSAGDGKGGVLLVWRTMNTNKIYYQWSQDNGASWGKPVSIPGIFARQWTHPYDMYDMAADSAGNIHLLAAGHLSQASGALLGIYHLVWNGFAWTQPEKVYEEQGQLPEYPKVVISAGNQIQSVWFTRLGDEYDQNVVRSVWYSRSEANAAFVPVKLEATATPPPPVPSPTATTTATPRPTLSSAGIVSSSLYTEQSYLNIIFISLLPIAAIIGIAFTVRLVSRRR